MRTEQYFRKGRSVFVQSQTVQFARSWIHFFARVLPLVVFGGCASVLSINPTEREKAVTRLNDQEVLVRVALYDGASNVRKAAIRKLTDQNGLAKVVARVEDHDIRKAAFMKLTDRAVLDRIVATATDPALRLAAEVRMGNKTWARALSNAQEKGTGLGDALAAIALFDRQPDVAEAVTRACHAYIQQGDVTRIPELKELLKLYGDKPLAEDYLNCGQRELAEAGRAWAAARGYTVQQGYGSHRVQWGSDKSR